MPMTITEKILARVSGTSQVKPGDRVKVTPDLAMWYNSVNTEHFFAPLERVGAKKVADPEKRVVTLTSEEEGVGLLAGAWLGGQRGVLLMQSSGGGNCINMLSLINAGRFPFLTIVSMRGDFGEQNPWQLPMGQAVEPCLMAMNTLCLRIETREDIPSTTEAATQMAYKSDQSVAILLSQKLIGAKPF